MVGWPGVEVMETALARVLESARCAFVGRAAELEALDAAIAAGARLITVVGPPGAGKSRLAAEAASRHAAAVAAPAAAPPLWIELQEADSAEAVLALLGKALATPLPGVIGAGDDLAAVTAALVARGPGLVVLDELEHVLPIVRPLLTRWLADAPGTTFITTSRERTGLPGERALDLGPLALPGPGEDPLASAAAQLFIARATAEHPRFRVSAVDGALVAAIVTALDGLPLAIELAAARRCSACGSCTTTSASASSSSPRWAPAPGPRAACAPPSPGRGTSCARTSSARWPSARCFAAASRSRPPAR